jgi:hypothetical protein
MCAWSFLPDRPPPLRPLLFVEPARRADQAHGGFEGAAAGLGIEGKVVKLTLRDDEQALR